MTDKPVLPPGVPRTSPLVLPAVESVVAVEDKITCIGGENTVHFGYVADTEVFVSGLRFYGFIWRSLSNSMRQVHLSYNSEGITWARGWHEPGSPEVEAMLAARAFT